MAECIIKVKARENSPRTRANNGSVKLLRDPAGIERLCALIAEKRSVQGACAALGVHPFQVWREARRDPDIGAAVTAARENAADALFDECVDIADAVQDPASAQVAKLQIDTRLRVAGKLRQDRYGDQASSVNASVNVAVGIVCDEARRARIIETRAKLFGGKPDPMLPDKTEEPTLDA